MLHHIFCGFAATTHYLEVSRSAKIMCLRWCISPTGVRTISGKPAAGLIKPINYLGLLNVVM